MDYPDQEYNERFLQSQIDGIKESIIAMNLEKKQSAERRGLNRNQSLNENNIHLKTSYYGCPAI